MAYGSPRQQSGFPRTAWSEASVKQSAAVAITARYIQSGLFNKAHVFADFIGDNFFALIKDHFILLKQVIAVSIDRYN